MPILRYTPLLVCYTLNLNTHYIWAGRNNVYDTKSECSKPCVLYVGCYRYAKCITPTDYTAPITARQLQYRLLADLAQEQVHRQTFDAS
jgi:hypothetical protein